MKNHHPVLSVVCFLVVLLVFLSEIAQAWTTSRRPPPRWASSSTTTPLSVKPPPATDFDLDAIEAFEMALDEQEEQAKLEDDDDDDDILTAPHATQHRRSPPQDDDIRTYTVDDTTQNQRLDAALATAWPDVSRSQCGSLIRDKRVHLVVDNADDGNNHAQQVLLDRKSVRVQRGQVLRVSIPPSPECTTEIVAENLPLEILYEDEYLIALNKAAGMVVHPAAGNWNGTVVNALAYYLRHASPYGPGELVDHNDDNDQQPGNIRPGVVHRLDRGTTGVLVVAKTTHSAAQLTAAFSERRVRKTYLAVTVGNPGTEVVIDKPIGRHPVHRQRMRVVPQHHTAVVGDGDTPRRRAVGKRALSYVDALASDGRLSVVRVRIATGRTHQIRVHLQDRRTPIYGDDVYGLSDWNQKLQKQQQYNLGKSSLRPLLHAYRLELAHPITGKPLVLQAPLADDMKRVARAIWSASSASEPEKEVPLFLRDEDSQ